MTVENWKIWGLEITLVSRRFLAYDSTLLKSYLNVDLRGYPECERILEWPLEREIHGKLRVGARQLMNYEEPG